MSWRNPRLWIWLTASHLGAVLLGLGAGAQQVRRSDTESTIALMAAAPRYDAAELAFRFGTREHAQQLTLSLPPPQLEDLADAEVMAREVRLAALFGEHEHTKGGPHLQAALGACRRFRSDCNLSALAKWAERRARDRLAGDR
jgi:hypothetical protein